MKHFDCLVCVVMSKSIVKKSLEIFDKTLKDSDEKSQRKLRAIQKRYATNNNKHFKSIPLDKKYSGKNIDQIRKEYSKEKDRTEENLKKLNLLKRSLLNQESTTSILKRATKSREEPEIVKQEEGTVFTEEDFAKFEREYVVD